MIRAWDRREQRTSAHQADRSEQQEVSEQQTETVCYKEYLPETRGHCSVIMFWSCTEEVLLMTRGQGGRLLPARSIRGDFGEDVLHVVVA